MFFTEATRYVYMTTINVGDQYEHESVGRVEVQDIEVKSDTVEVDDNALVTNQQELVDSGTVYVRLYSYVSGMPGQEELATFIEKTEPYEAEDDD